MKPLLWAEDYLPKMRAMGWLAFVSLDGVPRLVFSERKKDKAA
jgi:hypothetical protein